MTVFNKTLTQKVEFVRDVIVRKIQDESMAPGDRLPSYSKLRSELGFGSQTIADAVNSLCSLGVLEVRSKVGIFVKNPNGGHLTGRTIAVIIKSLTQSAYSGLLACYLQRLIIGENCHCLAFYHSDASSTNAPDFDDFPGLEQAVKEHQLDGVITMCDLSNNVLNTMEKNSVCCCFIGDDDHHHIPYQVVLDVRKFLNDAYNALRGAGCRKVCQLCIDRRQADSRSDFMPVLIGNGYRGGADIADALLKLPPEKRPDGIVSDDDTLVSGFLSELLIRPDNRGDKSYLPIVATIVHEELAELYPSSRIILFSQNIRQYAHLAVDLLMQMMQEKEIAVKSIAYRFMPVDNHKPKQVKRNA